jgi:hypothetical protein
MIGRECQATVRNFLVKNYSKTIGKNERLLLNKREGQALP